MKTLKGILVLIGATVASDWLIVLIPIDTLPIPDFMVGIMYHLVSAGFWVLLVKLLYPKVLERFTYQFAKNKLKVSALVVSFFIFTPLLHVNFKTLALDQLLMSFAFTLSIGIDEEYFSRGLIFGAFEHLGIHKAALISSFHFGLLHFGNYIWGGQSLDYTLGQMVNAASFGYLCCGLMIYSGSILPSVIFHGFSDFPLFLQSKSDFISQVTGGTEWVPTLIQSSIYFVAGLILMNFECPSSIGRFTELATKLGLIEKRD